MRDCSPTSPIAYSFFSLSLNVTGTRITVKIEARVACTLDWNSAEELDILYTDFRIY